MYYREVRWEQNGRDIDAQGQAHFPDRKLTAEEMDKAQVKRRRAVRS
jgi:hypothetical protein